MKNQGSQNSHFALSLESAEFTNNKQGKSALHFLTANHVLEVFVKLKSMSWKRNIVLLWRFWIGFLFVFIKFLCRPAYESSFFNLYALHWPHSD